MNGLGNGENWCHQNKLKNVSKNNMSPKKKCKTNEAPMVQQPYEGPLERKNIKTFDEPMLNSFKHSLMTNGAIFIHPHLL
jgi:hypothetical protein